MNSPEFDKIVDLICNSNRIVVLTGAGISTTSGIPDFRGPDGIITREERGEKATSSGEPDWDKFQPNEGHTSLVDLYNLGKLEYLITQNIDDLHSRAGFPDDKIIELHGNIYKLMCRKCNKKIKFETMELSSLKLNTSYRRAKINAMKVKCINCGHILSYSIIHFGDLILESDLDKSFKVSRSADLFIAIGSTLLVKPACVLPKKAKNEGAKFVIINLGETDYDYLADYKLNARIEIILPEIVTAVRQKLNSKSNE